MSGKQRKGAGGVPIVKSVPVYADDPLADFEVLDACSNGQTAPALGFPAIVYGDEIASQEIILPNELIVGMLHRGAKMVLGGGSKSFKTWCLADCALSIATGSSWWGREVRQGRAIYLNFEVQDGFFRRRLMTIAEAKGVKLPRELAVWNLRGHCSDHRILLPKLTEQLRGQDFSAIFLDPAYKLMHGSENAQEEVAALMNSIERLGEATGAATVFGAHFAKGSAAQKEAIDRISGSGVFARDPDTILTMTRHKEKDVFVIDPILRNCPPVDPFCVRWEFPLMRADDSLNPNELRQPMAKSSKNVEDLLALVPVEGTVEKTEFIDAAYQVHGFLKIAVRPMVAQLLKDGRLFEWKMKRSGKRDELHLARKEQVML